MHIRKSLFLYSMVLLISWGMFVEDASARFIRLDSGPNWADPALDFPAAAILNNSNGLAVDGDGSAAANLGFAIDFGIGSLSSLTIHENGFVSFGGGNNISAINTDFVSNPVASDVEQAGAISYNQGVFDPAGVFGVDPTDAFRVQWFDPGNDLVFQIVIIDTLPGAGNFSLELNYGCEIGRCPTATVGDITSMAGFLLGANTAALTGPFSPDDDFTFNFVNGQLVTAVPEPGTFALLSAGLAGLGFMRRKRTG